MRERQEPVVLHLAKLYDIDSAIDDLWEILQEREQHENISHYVMPTMEEHAAFVNHHPYRVWYLIREKHETIGSIYLTHRNEIGIFIFKKFRGRGYGKWAVQKLMVRWGRALRRAKSYVRHGFLANIAPGNNESKIFFFKLGFKHVQDTYCLDVEPR